MSRRVPPPPTEPRPRLCSRRSTRREARRRPLPAQPRHRRHESRPQQRDVEHVGPVGLLARQQEVEQERAEPGAVQHLGDEPVARAVPAAPLPCANTTNPVGASGTCRSAARPTPSCGISTCGDLSARDGRHGSPARRRSGASSSRMTSSSLVGEKSSYAWPTAWKPTGDVAQTTWFADGTRDAASVGPTGTASTTRCAPRERADPARDLGGRPRGDAVVDDDRRAPLERSRPRPSAQQRHAAIERRPLLALDPRRAPRSRRRRARRGRS